MNKMILIPLHSLNYFLECSQALELSDPNFKLTRGETKGAGAAQGGVSSPQLPHPQKSPLYILGTKFHYFSLRSRFIIPQVQLTHSK